MRDLSSVRVWFHHRRTLLVDIPPRRFRSRPPRIARDLDAARRQQGIYDDDDDGTTGPSQKS